MDTGIYYIKFEDKSVLSFGCKHPDWLEERFMSIIVRDTDDEDLINFFKEIYKKHKDCLKPPPEELVTHLSSRGAYW
jgi:hypothetical protein